MISMTTWIALMMEREGKWWGGQWEGKWHHDDDEEDSDNNKNLHKIIEIKKKNYQACSKGRSRLS